MHARRHRRLHVEGAVTHVPCARRVRLQLICRHEQQVWLGFGVLDVTAIHDGGLVLEPECLDRRTHLLPPTGRADSPRDSRSLECGR